MTRRTRLFLVAAAAVLVVGLGTGLLASYMGLPQLALIGSDGPEELQYVPTDAKLVAYLDVREVMSSVLRQKFRELHPDRQAGSDSLEQQTGINVERDVDHVVAVMLDGASASNRPLLLARGRFDEVRIEGLIREKGGQITEHNGKRLFVIAEGDQGMALTFAEPGLAIAGDAAAVRVALDTRGGSQNVTDNAELMQLVRDIDDGNAWAVGRFDAVAGGRLPSELSNQLPPINWFAASGHINGGVTALLRADARDDEAARNLRDVIRGFVALGRLQAGRNPAIAALLNTLELGGVGKTVSLTFSVPAEVIDMIPSRTGTPQQATPGGSAPVTPEPPQQQPTRQSRPPEL